PHAAAIVELQHGLDAGGLQRREREVRLDPVEKGPHGHEMAERHDVLHQQSIALEPQGDLGPSTYSAASATVGSILVTRSAGRRLAVVAVTVSTRTTMAATDGSCGSTWYRTGDSGSDPNRP